MMSSCTVHKLKKQSLDKHAMLHGNSGFFIVNFALTVTQRSDEGIMLETSALKSL